MDLLNVFLSPRKAVKEAYEKPNVGLGAVLILVPFLLLVLVGFYYGINIDFASVLFFMGKNILFWFIASVILFLLIFILKGKNSELNLGGVLYGLSLTQLISLVVFAVVFISLLALSPNIFSDLAKISHASSAEEALQGLSEITFNESLSLPIMAFLGVIGAIYGLYLLYFAYLLVSVPKKDWIAKNVIILLLFFGIAGTVFALMPF